MAAPKIYNTGVIVATPPLLGTERVVIDTGGPRIVETTTQAIANLAGGSVQTVNTAITTVGAGVLSAAAIVGRLITRSGSVAAFSDATDTAVNIIAAMTNAFIGESFQITIKNVTAFTETITNGLGVTVTGITAIPGDSWARFLVTYASAGAVTMLGMEIGALVSLPPAQFNTAAFTVATLAAGIITGADMCYVENSGSTPGAQTVRTAAQMLADIPGGYVGLVTAFRIINKGAGVFTLTADAGATVTITGTATIAQNITRDYTLTFNTATTATIQSVGSGVSP